MSVSQNNQKKKTPYDFWNVFVVAGRCSINNIDRFVANATR